VDRVSILALSDGCAGPRAPVLTCRDALSAAGVHVDLITAASDADIDAALGYGGPLIAAVASDGQLRAVVRRLLRRYAAKPGSRPPDLPEDRTVADLPPIGVLPDRKSVV